MDKFGNNDYRFKKRSENIYRRMVIREIIRIQGFPDTFKFIYNNANDAYKMIRNAVLVNLAYEIAFAIKKTIKRIENKYNER